MTTPPEQTNKTEERCAAVCLHNYGPCALPAGHAGDTHVQSDGYRFCCFVPPSPPEPIGERIVGPAIRTARGELWSERIPASHYSVSEKMRTAGFAAPLAPDNEQGFVTSVGDFVNRREAYKIAEAAGQIVNQMSGGRELFSEWLWKSAAADQGTQERCPCGCHNSVATGAAPCVTCLGLTGRSACIAAPPEPVGELSGAAHYVGGGNDANEEKQRAATENREGRAGAHRLGRVQADGDAGMRPRTEAETGHLRPDERLQPSLPEVPQRPTPVAEDQGTQERTLVCPHCKMPWVTTVPPRDFTHCPECRGSFSFAQPSLAAPPEPVGDMDLDMLICALQEIYSEECSGPLNSPSLRGTIIATAIERLARPPSAAPVEPMRRKHICFKAIGEACPICTPPPPESDDGFKTFCPACGARNPTAEALLEAFDAELSERDAELARTTPAAAPVEQGRGEGRLSKAATALAATLRAIHEDDLYKGVWLMAQLHQGPYAGPTYTAELEALEAALPSPPAPVEQKHRCGFDPCTAENCKMRRSWIERLAEDDGDEAPAVEQKEGQGEWDRAIAEAHAALDEFIETISDLERLVAGWPIKLETDHPLCIAIHAAARASEGE